MIRKLKALGLVVVAVLAMSAIGASAAQAITLSSSSYPQTVEGSGTEIGEHFLTEAGKVECHLSKYTGTLSEASPTLRVTPIYETCKAFGFLNATVNTNGCHYLFHATEHDSSTNTYTAHVDVECTDGKVIEITSGTCKVSVGSQTGLTTVDITNMAVSPPDLTVRPTVKGIAYTVTQDGFGCPFTGTGAKTGGEYTSTGYITVTAAGGLTVST